MITLHTDLRAALRTILLAVAGLPSGRAWEGVAFTPTPNQAWLRESLRPISSIPKALGVGGTIEHTLTYNISLFYPAGGGTLTIEQMAGAIVQAMMPGTSLVYGTTKGTILRSERSPLVIEPQWISVPLAVTANAYTSR